MTVTVKNAGDLLQENTDAIVNTVNCVGVMGKGIALQFKQRWPRNFKAYEAACKRREVSIGKMFVFDLGHWERPRFIINFPTKTHWRSDSKLHYIELGLADLINQVKLLKIESIALPPLGCGNGGLDWDDVRKLIVSSFAAVPSVQVSAFEPMGAPPPREMAIRTVKPEMTAARAAIIKVISVYREMEYGLSKIEVQKLAYFLEQAGQPLRLKFEKHTFGPYSDSLRHVLKAMDGHYVNGVGDFASKSEISVLSGAVAEADDFLRRKGGEELTAQVSRVRSLINGFETPYGMELLSTVHWVAVHDRKARTPDEAVTAVHCWSARKKAVLRDEHIRIAWRRLEEQGWFTVVPSSTRVRLQF